MSIRGALLEFYDDALDVVTENLSASTGLIVVTVLTYLDLGAGDNVKILIGASAFVLWFILTMELRSIKITLKMGRYMVTECIYETCCEIEVSRLPKLLDMEHFETYFDRHTLEVQHGRLIRTDKIRL